MRTFVRSALLLTVLTTAIACSSTPAPSDFNGGGNGGDPASGNNGGGSFGSGSNGSSGSSGASGGTGSIADTPSCDGSLSGNAAEDFARAMGICTSADKDGYGLVSAKFSRGYNRNDEPKVQQHSILSKFGAAITPREGGQLVALSTGYAQEFDGPGQAPFGGDSIDGTNGIDWWGASHSSGNGTAPPGFPKPAAGCPIDSNVNDTVNLVLQLKAPDGATGFKFDFDFYSGEWPAYVCSRFNDGFVAYLESKATHDNISFDKNNAPVSVNNGFFDRCTPGMTTGCESGGGGTSTSQCPGGPGELAGTGFGIIDQWCPTTSKQSTNGGATGWLTSQAPVDSGETFTLQLMIWDTGDGVLDSSILLDNFKWLGGAPVQTGTDRSTPH
ncbi:MAG TPA: choice-of-anchor L domain-containing protein [Labilithrix sp.]